MLRTRLLSTLLVTALPLACADAEKENDEGKAEAGAEGTDSAGAKDKPLTELSEEEIQARLRLGERDFPLLIWSAARVQMDYYAAERFSASEQLASALEYLGLHTPEFFGEVEGGAMKVSVDGEAKEFEFAKGGDPLTSAEALEPVLSFTRDKLDLDGEPLHEMEYAAINGFLAPLDPHTILLTPEEHAALGVKTAGQFGGIGAEIRAQDRRVVVIRVLDGSPALTAGLKAGDVFVKIAGQSTVNMTVQEAGDLLRGPVETKVEVVVLRDGKEKTISIERGLIKIDSVVSEPLGKGVGYIKISTFQKNTAEKFGAAITSLNEKEPLKGIVLDLRDNSGGLLTQAAELLDQVVEKGELVIIRSAAEREQMEAEKPEVLAADVPIVVLVDEDAASAAEIVAGGLKHLGRAIVVGRTSFGKGTVQQVKPWAPYGRELALKETVAEYRVSGDRKINSVGVRPDVAFFPVQLTELVGVGNVYDRERFERARQRARTAHLPSAKHDEGASAFASPIAHQVRLLAGAAAELAPDGPEPLRDAEIRLAHAIAVGLAGLGKRAEQLAKLGELIPALAKTEDGRIADGLSQAWKRADLWGGELGFTSDGALKVTATLSKDEPTLAGEPFTVKLSVTNDGSDAVERVHVITDCQQDEIDGIEVLLGRIGAGETVNQDLHLAVMPWHRDFTDELRLAAHAGEPGAKPDGDAAVKFEVAAAPRPRFGFDWWIVDDPGLAAKAPKRPPAPKVEGHEPFEVKGNGDGILQPGEQVLIAFRARNTGEGAARAGNVVIQNLSGAQGLLEEGQFPVGEMKSGGVASGAFGFTVSPKADPGLPVELELIVGDGILRERVDDRFRLRVEPGRPAFEPKAGKRKVAAGKTAVVRNAATAKAPELGVLIEGASVSVLGVAGDFVAVELEPGRRAWIAAADLEDGGDGKSKVVRTAWIVDPPVIDLGDLPTQTDQATVELHGKATHPKRVRDVAVWVKPSGPGHAERKVVYEANTDVDGEGARTLPLKMSVPLAKGNNRIRVVVRDGDKVERREDVWVFRK